MKTRSLCQNIPSQGIPYRTALNRTAPYRITSSNHVTTTNRIQPGDTLPARNVKTTHHHSAWHDGISASLLAGMHHTCQTSGRTKGQQSCQTGGQTSSVTRMALSKSPAQQCTRMSAFTTQGSQSTRRTKDNRAVRQIVRRTVLPAWRLRSPRQSNAHE